MKPKILWHSNAPWSPVGYGVQTGLFTPRIRDLGYEVTISAFYGLAGQMMVWDGMAVLPGDEAWGNRLIAAYAAEVGGNDPRGVLTITLMDVWVLHNQYLSQLNLASWVPVDHDPAPLNVISFFEQTGSRPIAMSRFGERKLQEAGLDPLYVPHGVDTKVLRPIEGSRDTLREMFHIPTDAFVVGMVANNKGFSPSRKAFPEVFEAFARLRQKRSDAFLYVHAEKTGVAQGINLEAMAEFFGIAEAVMFAPQTKMEIGISQESMAEVYSMMDVLASPSYGEGFGIPIIEAQACGKPVIVTDFSAMTELCGAGWMVGGERWYDAGQAAFFLKPSVSEITSAMLKAHDHADRLQGKAVEFAQAYDVETITAQYWKGVLEELISQDAPVMAGLE